MTTAVAERLDVDEFLAMPGNEDFELIDGLLKERGMGLNAVWTAGQIFAELSRFNATTRGGLVFPDGASLAIFPDRPRYAPRPDGLYVSQGRFRSQSMAQGALTVPPELLVEVVSTHDIAGEVEGKVRAYLGAGVDTVWVAYPEQRTIHVYRRAGPTEVLTDGDTLLGDGPLSGFAVGVTALFPEPEPAREPAAES